MFSSSAMVCNVAPMMLPPQHLCIDPELLLNRYSTPVGWPAPRVFGSATVWPRPPRPPGTSATGVRKGRPGRPSAATGWLFLGDRLPPAVDGRRVVDVDALAGPRDGQPDAARLGLGPEPVGGLRPGVQR